MSTSNSSTRTATLSVVLTCCTYAPPDTVEPHCSSRASHLPYSSSASPFASYAAEPSERRSPLSDLEPGRAPDVAGTLPDIPVVEVETEAAEIDASRSHGGG